MKKFLTILGLLAFFSVSFISCKKEKTKTVAERIVGKWQITSVVYNNHQNGSDHVISTNDFSATDIYEFKSDGTVQMTFQGDSGSSTYSISAENKLVITNDETYDIKTLTDHSLVLYLKTVSGADYEEITISFKK